jgi:2-polyprenyl-3-methyl-5-hydroxy-6-metoxy-1,4-benzoquinol methylase
MLALLGDVRGKRVLDPGCGAGALAEALLERGAIATGVEISEGMAQLATDGPRATLTGRSSLIS